MSIPNTPEVGALTAAGPVVPVQEARPKRRNFRFVQNPKALTGLTILGIFLVLAVIGPWIAPYDPDARSDQLVKGPSSAHWLGTTHLGQDILSQLLIGTRGVMFVGFLAGAVAVVLSIILGITSGYLGGLADDCLSALTNVFLVIPALPLIIIISATIKSAGDLTVALTIGFTSWAYGARVLRAQTLSLRQRDYIQASRATGETTWRIVIFEIMPNLVAIIASGFVSTVIFAVMSEITLAFIGVSNVSTWNWGTILFWAQSEQALAQGAWWWFVPAGLAIALLGTALALLNFGIDEFVSPRLRSSGASSVRTEDGRKIRMRVGFTPVLMSRKKPNPVDAGMEQLDVGRQARAGNSRTATPVLQTPVGKPSVVKQPGVQTSGTPAGKKPASAPVERKGVGQ